MDYLLCALEGSAFTLVTTQTLENPFIVWNILTQMYERRQEEDLQTVQEDLVAFFMKRGEKPTDYRNCLRLLNERFANIDIKYILDDLQLKTHLLTKVTDNYTSV